jgi:hypothetical protein
MPYVLRVAGLAHSRSNELGGTYIVAFDPDAAEGRGHAEHTYDKGKAKRFPTQEAAVEFWKQTSRVRPWRPDGKANRPLTAFHMLVEWVEA